jgi:hypothetical protein
MGIKNQMQNDCGGRPYNTTQKKKHLPVELHIFESSKSHPLFFVS